MAVHGRGGAVVSPADFVRKSFCDAGLLGTAWPDDSAANVRDFSNLAFVERTHHPRSLSLSTVRCRIKYSTSLFQFAW